MVQAFAVRERIEAPTDRVWAELTAWERAPGWMAGVEVMRADGPTAAGTHLRYRAGPGKAEQVSTITACEPGRLVTVTSARGPVRASYTYALVPQGMATEASLVVDVRTAGAARVFGPVLRRAMKRADGGHLRALRRVLEQPTARAPLDG